jgi:hypothetical protein
MIMSETRKTLIIGGAGLLLLVVAFATAPRPSTPDDFSDRGETFFPDFTDPNAATTLEVVDFSEETAAARPFKVTFQDGLWTIPSHFGYPADGKDRLAKTAAGLIGLRKDDFRSSNLADQEACGVVDPLDDKASTLKGRGKRVTIKDKNGQVLADLIFGKKLEGHPDYRFVRVPGQNRIYVTHTDLDISTKFTDWIEKDLLLIDPDKIEQLTLRDYSINERMGTIDQHDVLQLTRKNGNWTANRTRANQEVDSAKMGQLTRAIDGLTIVDVRTKPAGLTEDLKRSGGKIPLSRENAVALQNEGYYFTRDGNLVSNEGELEVASAEGIRYLLRFGEVVAGSADESNSSGEQGAPAAKSKSENRYLFITTSFDKSLLDKEPPQARDRSFEKKSKDKWTDQDRENQAIQAKHDAWEKKLEDGRKKAQELNERFAGWYYVISGDSFDKIHIKRSDLIKAKKS